MVRRSRIECLSAMQGPRAHAGHLPSPTRSKLSSPCSGGTISSQGVAQPSRRSSTACKYYMMGRCTRGPCCGFAHPANEQLHDAQVTAYLALTCYDVLLTFRLPTNLQDHCRKLCPVPVLYGLPTFRSTACPQYILQSLEVESSWQASMLFPGD